MALIKCTKCGQMVSDRAEKCPKCGYPVHLSMKQQEETKQSVEPHTTTLNTSKEEVANGNPQPQQRGSKKGIIIAIVVVVIIGCGVLFALLNSNNGSNDQQQDKRSEITEQFANNVQKYEKLNNFHEGLAAVQHNGLWGYIDKEGNEVIPCQYESAEDFNNSRARFIIIQIISLLIRTIRTYMVVATSIMREKKLLLAYIRQFLPFLMVCHE